MSAFEDHQSWQIARATNRLQPNHQADSQVDRYSKSQISYVSMIDCDLFESMWISPAGTSSRDTRRLISHARCSMLQHLSLPPEIRLLIMKP
jgi:hypothetical protein